MPPVAEQSTRPVDGAEGAMNPEDTAAKVAERRAVLEPEGPPESLDVDPADLARMEAEEAAKAEAELAEVRQVLDTSAPQEGVPETTGSEEGEVDKADGEGDGSEDDDLAWAENFFTGGNPAEDSTEVKPTESVSMDIIDGDELLDDESTGSSSYSGSTGGSSGRAPEAVGLSRGPKRPGLFSRILGRFGWIAGNK